MSYYSSYKLLKKTGITAIIIKMEKILVLKRVALPFMRHPGVWTFVGGKKKTNETYDETAYREVWEETGLEEKDIRLVAKYNRVLKVDAIRKIKYYDVLYVFGTYTGSIRRNFEHTAHRWACLSDIKGQREYTNLFADKRFVEKAIESVIFKAKAI